MSKSDSKGSVDVKKSFITTAAASSNFVNFNLLSSMSPKLFILTLLSCPVPSCICVSVPFKAKFVEVFSKPS